MLQWFHVPLHCTEADVAVGQCADARYFARWCGRPKCRSTLLSAMVQLAQVPMHATWRDGAVGQSAEVRYLARWCGWPMCRCTLLRPMVPSANVARKAGAWVKIAHVLGLKLDQLHRVACSALIEIGGSRAKSGRRRTSRKGKPQYEYLSMDALAIDKALNNVDLHKLRQTGWHSTLSEQRAALIEQLRAIDMQVRSARQPEIFLQFYTHLLGNETGRVLPRMKQKQKFTARRVPKPKGQKKKKKKKKKKR